MIDSEPTVWAGSPDDQALFDCIYSLKRRTIMEIKTDIQIAQETEMMNIQEIAAAAGIEPEHTELYGNYKAKID